MFRKYLAGVSFTDTTAHLAVLHAKKGSIRLRYLQEFEKGQNDDLWFLEPLLRRDKRAVRKVAKVSVALDVTKTFLHSFPIDSTLNQSDQNEHISWELSNYIPDFNSDGYIKDTRILRTRAQEQVAELFVVAVKRDIVLKIQDALAAKKIDLHLVESNHYSAQYALLVNYPEVKTKMVALVGVSRGRVDVGFLNNGRLLFYRYAMTNSEDEVLEFLQTLVPEFPITDMFFYGMSASHSLVTSSHERFKVNAEMLNPLRNIPIARSYRADTTYSGHEYRFAAAIGCALRKE